MTEAKSFTIEKREVWEAFRHVDANQGAAGVDGPWSEPLQALEPDVLWQLHAIAGTPGDDLTCP